MEVYGATKRRAGRVAAARQIRRQSEDSTTSSSAQQPRRRNRQINSCHQCRTRKMKCDQKKPSCSNCARRGGACDYYRNDAEARKKLAEAKDHQTELMCGLTHKIEARKHTSSAADIVGSRSIADNAYRDCHMDEDHKVSMLDTTDSRGTSVERAQEPPSLTHDYRTPNTSPRLQTTLGLSSPYSCAGSLSDTDLDRHPSSIYQSPCSYPTWPAYQSQMVGGYFGSSYGPVSATYTPNHHGLPLIGGAAGYTHATAANDLHTLYQSSRHDGLGSIPTYPMYSE